MKNMIQHPQFGEVRTEKVGSDFVFCAKDVYEVLDLIWKGSKNMGYLDEDEKVSKKVYTAGGNQEMVFVTESGLYALIIRSNKPSARKFRKWITSEVLPSLRKYGTYSMDEKVMDRAKAKAERKAIAQMLKEINDRLSASDKRLVAKQCLATEFYVSKVLHGEIQDCYMVSLLLARATGNKELNKIFYTQEGAETIMQELMQKSIR